MSEMLNVHQNIELWQKRIHYRSFPEVLKEVQGYITKSYANVLNQSFEESRELVKAYIQKYVGRKEIRGKRYGTGRAL